MPQVEDVPLETESCILDAVSTLARSTACREAIAASEVLHHAMERSLGRGAPDAMCIPAMHVIAAVSGAEILHESNNIQLAFLSDSVWLQPF
jgi:hypothetical protein